MKNFITFFIFYFFTAILFAQSSQFSTDLSEVVITATKTETSPVAIASSYSVITSEQIIKSQKSNLYELIRDLEGVSIAQQGGPGKLTSVFIRGANSNHTLVMIDGIKINDAGSANNAYDLSSMMLENIERIEIVRGPQSTLYGSEAMAGVINIITKKGSGRPSYKLSTETGSNNHFKGGLNISGGIGSLRYSFGLSQFTTDGISAISSKYGNKEKDGFDNSLASGRIDLELFSNTSLNFIYRYNLSKSSIDQSTRFGDDPNYKYNTEEQVFGANADISLFNRKWINKFSFGLTRRINDSKDETDLMHPDDYSNSFNNSSRLKFAWQNELSLIENNLATIGIETETESSNSYLNSFSSWGLYQSEFPKQSTNTTGFYFQDQYNGIKNLFITAGLRLDNHEKFGSEITYRFAPAYLISATGTKLKFTYGTGFKAPSLYYLFDPLYGNPDLKPEENIGWDAGIEQLLLSNSMIAGITYFDMQFSELFGYDQNFKTINIDKAATSGVELFVKYMLDNVLSVNLNYGYTKAINKSEGVSKENEALIRRPNEKYSININYLPTDELNININHSFVGSRKDDDFDSWPSGRVTLKSYSLTDFAISYKPLGFIKLKARVENIFDSQYEEILYYGTFGRSFYFGAELSF